jgi:hypothetical protein
MVIASLISDPYIEFMFRHTRSRQLRIALAVLVILGGVLIDLRFAAHPALFIALLLAAAALLVIGGLLLHRRGQPPRSDKNN